MGLIMQTLFYVDAQGNYLGGFCGAEPPEGAIEVPFPPSHASQKWDGEKYLEDTEQIIARLEGALDRHLDAVAKSYRYTNIARMVGYRGDDNPQFNAEGVAAFKWRSAVYTYGIQCIEDVNAGLRTIPTEAELIDELPLITDFLPAA
jgi:hypothetical protein